MPNSLAIRYQPRQGANATARKRTARAGLGSGHVDYAVGAREPKRPLAAPAGGRDGSTIRVGKSGLLGKSITDLAEQEGVTDAYVCRLLPLTCLAPDIVEAILDGWQPKGLRLAEILGNGPLVWTTQRESLGFSN
jgi:hypothetical protein